jgi:putative transposase
MYKKRKQYRLPDFNYATNAVYFVTIVCSNRSHFFGKVDKGFMYYSEVGEIASNEIKTAIEFKKDTMIHEHVIMPNHVHILVELRNESITNIPEGVLLPMANGSERRGRLGPLQKGSLGAFINRYKGRVTRRCRDIGFVDFGWQPKYHDRVVRNRKEYDLIAAYINENISNWDNDQTN